jgi:peptide/nickel transport system permease protein
VAGEGGPELKRYLAGRLVQLVAVLFVVSVMVFTLVRLIPGDPATVQLGSESTPQALAALRTDLGLDRPLWVQYGRWVENLLRGDFGQSWVSKQSPLALIRRFLPATLQLMGAAFAIALVIAFPAGILAARYPRSWLDRAITALALMGVSLPSFWLGIMLILAVALRTGWFPPSGYAPFWEDPAQAVRTTALPAFTLGVGLAAPLSRFLRSGMLDVLGTEYIRTARAKGLAEGAVVVRHALKNAMLPVVTVLALQAGTLVGGTFVIEQVFAWPGIGRLSLTAIQHRDYAIIQAVVLLVAAGFVLINFLVDAVYVWLDPRIRFEAER